MLDWANIRDPDEVTSVPQRSYITVSSSCDNSFDENESSYSLSRNGTFPPPSNPQEEAVSPPVSIFPADIVSLEVQDTMNSAITHDCKVRISNTSSGSVQIDRDGFEYSLGHKLANGSSSDLNQHYDFDLYRHPYSEVYNLRQMDLVQNFICRA